MFVYLYIKIKVHVWYIYFYFNLLLNCLICIHPHGQKKTILQSQSFLNVCTRHRKMKNWLLHGGFKAVWYPKCFTNWIDTNKFNATTCNYLTEFCNHTRASMHQSSVKLIILLKKIAYNFICFCNMMDVWLLLSVFRVSFNNSSKRAELVFTARQNILS